MYFKILNELKFLWFLAEQFCLSTPVEVAQLTEPNPSFQKSPWWAFRRWTSPGKAWTTIKNGWGRTNFPESWSGFNLQRICKRRSCLRQRFPKGVVYWISSFDHLSLVYIALLTKKQKRYIIKQSSTNCSYNGVV